MDSQEAWPTVPQTSKLLQSPRDIFRTILEVLHGSDRQGFKSLRLVSRACQRESEFLLFRTVTLHDKNPSAKSSSTALVKRLLDDRDPCHTYVRNLSVGPFTDEQWFYLEILPSLPKMIKSFTHLETLSWLTPHGTGVGYGVYSSGQDLLTVLHQTHPSAALNVTYDYRQFIPIDRALLSSSQLHTLEITTYFNNLDSPLISELPIIMEGLRRGNSIKVLDLDFAIAIPPSRSGERDPIVRFRTWEGVSSECANGQDLNFPWRKGDRFPALEELRFRDDWYDFTAENCKLWARVTDWAQLKRLRLDRCSPRHLFASLTNRVPNMKCLEFAIEPPLGRSSQATQTLQPLRAGIPILRSFVSSIPALIEAKFRTFNKESFNKVLPIILELQGSNLRELDMCCQNPDMGTWEPKQYLAVFEKAPNLESLNIEIFESILGGKWAGRRSTLSPWEKFESTAKNDKIWWGATLDKTERKKALRLHDSFTYNPGFQ